MNGLYEISNTGKVRSLNYNREKRIKELRPYMNTRGYWAVTLFNNNNEKVKMVHRLVAEAFIENIENNALVNHKDGNKLNNNADNLEWCTPQHNIKEAFRIGLNKTKQGTEHHLSRKVKQYDKNYNYIKTWGCIKDIQKELGFKTANISACCRGKAKRAYGYIWEYVKYIEVDKIRDKIEELNKKRKYCSSDEMREYHHQIEILKELLGE